MLACDGSRMVDSVIREHQDAAFSSMLMRAASVPAAGAARIAFVFTAVEILCRRYGKDPHHRS